MTGAEYRKQPFGPATPNLPDAVRSLREQGALDVERRDYFGFPKDDFIVKRPPDASRLADRERALLDDVIAFVAGKSAGPLSELSPDEAWAVMNIGDRIPYYSAYSLYLVGLSGADIAWGREEARRIAALRGTDGG